MNNKALLLYFSCKTKKMMMKHHTYWKSNLRRRFSILAFSIVLFSFLFDMAAPHLLADAEQQNLVELVGEDEVPKEDSKKEKEKEEDEKLDHVTAIQSLYAPHYVAMRHYCSDRVDHLHYISVPTPPPDCA